MSVIWAHLEIQSILLNHELRLTRFPREDSQVSTFHQLLQELEDYS